MNQSRTNAGEAGGTMDAVTLQSCATEPIRLPGSVQPHGFLLVLDEGGTVRIASENAEDHLNFPLKLLLGSSLETVLPREIVSVLSQVRRDDAPENVTNYLGSFLLHGNFYSVSTHTVGVLRVLELEMQDRLVGAEMMNGVITNFVGVLSKVANSQELLQAAVRQVQHLTGFDRVLLYRFDEAGAGTVLAEENNGNLPSYLDLRFPDSDIPQQARDLYLLNTIRIIPDVDYKPSPLVDESGVPTRSLDLSTSTLRSVSPIHLQYMRNMGTLSSMSISIVCDGKLWGLISGHHATPHRVPYLIRSACDMLSKLVGTQLASFDTAERLSRTVYFHSVQAGLLTQIAAEKNFYSVLTDRMDLLQEIAAADGTALGTGGEWVTGGTTPDADAIAKIAVWLEERGDTLFYTSQLSEHLPWADSIREVASGLIAARLSDVNQRYILWFRPEVVQTVQWAGDPADAEKAEQTLTPRASFATWSETVRGKSAAWTEMEIASAGELRAAMVTVVLKRAEEDAELSEARFQQLTQTLPTKIFTTDNSGKINYVNNRWREADLSTEGLWFEDGTVLPGDLERCRAAWEHAVASGTEFREEVRLCERGNNERWNFIHAAPFRAARGGTSGWVASCADLTERREREAALRMTEKLALTGRMTSVIAHEINNPLESITNLMYLLRNEMPETGPAQEYVNMAESELLRISGITKQTLRWNREVPGKISWSTADALFDDVLRLFQGKIRNRQVTVQTDPGMNVRIYGIEGQLRQMIANLISNAVDAARVGGKVWISVREEDGFTIFEVRDNGIGMDEATQAQIFKPFFSTKGDLGNGLGLYISHEIVERHGGTMTVVSKPDAGTTMVVRLPIHVDEE